MVNLIYLSLATASISFTVTEIKLFLPIREWIKEHNSFLGELLTCGYCFGHWIAFVLVVIYRPRMFDCCWLMDYFFTALVISWLAGFQWVVMCRLMDKAGK